MLLDPDPKRFEAVRRNLESRKPFKSVEEMERLKLWDLMELRKQEEARVEMEAEGAEPGPPNLVLVTCLDSTLPEI